jgi:hypothetical protein
MDYRPDVWPVTNCGRAQQLWGMRNKSGEFLFSSTGRILQSSPPLNFTDFMKGIGELLMTLYFSAINEVY